MNSFRIFAVLLIFLNRILNEIRSDRFVLCHLILSFIHRHGLLPRIFFQYIPAAAESLHPAPPAPAGNG